MDIVIKSSSSSHSTQDIYEEHEIIKIFPVVSASVAFHIFMFFSVIISVLPKATFESRLKNETAQNEILLQLTKTDKMKSNRCTHKIMILNIISVSDLIAYKLLHNV